VMVANRLMPHATPMQSATGTWGTVTKNSYDTAAEEAAAIAKAIKAEIERGTTANEIAVLLRTNKLCQEYKKVLIDSGIAVRAKKQQETPLDWRIARAFIAMLTNPESDRLTYNFLQLKCGTDSADAMQRQATADFQSINERWLHIRNMQLADVTTAMTSAGLDRESVGRVRQMIETLQQNATVLELQAALLARESEAQEGDGVTVTTCHSSKGREFDCVWLPAWEEGIIPGRGDEAEERRLAYVSITRARKLVAISWAKRRTKEWTGVQDMKPSRFIQEISEL
jgi:superfamily I DNA/RNA helicase